LRCGRTLREQLDGRRREGGVVQAVQEAAQRGEQVRARGRAARAARSRRAARAHGACAAGSKDPGEGCCSWGWAVWETGKAHMACS
jgi:hypothetical protein